MKKYAVLDLGSNSIRLLLCQYENGKIEGEKFLIMTRLGKNVDSTGRLSDESMKATIEALQEFKSKSEAYGAEEIFAMATSAVRDASNGSDFVKQIKDETGINVEILSGESEARVGVKGVVAGLDEVDRTLIIDIGGGSTELIVYDEGIQFSRSLNLGAVRMTGKHVSSDPLVEGDLIKLKVDVESSLNDTLKVLSDYTIDKAIGIGGTATTFGAIQLEMGQYDRRKIHNYNLTYQQLDDIIKKLEALSVDERKQIRGLDPRRADIIHTGGLILENILSGLNLSNYTISDFDNLEGYLVECLEYE